MRSNGVMLKGLHVAEESLDEETSRAVSQVLATEQFGINWLCEAIARGDRAESQRLMAAGVPLDKAGSVLLKSEFGISSHSATPLTVAAAIGDLEMMEILMARGTPLEGDRLNCLGGPVYYAIFSDSPQADEVVRVLLAAGASPNGHGFPPQPVVIGETVLMEALKLNKTSIVRQLVESGADIHAIHSTNGENALAFALLHKNMEAVELLLARGAQMNYRFMNRYEDRLQYVDLMQTAAQAGPEFVKALRRAQYERACANSGANSPARRALAFLDSRVSAGLKQEGEAPIYTVANDEKGKPSLHIGFRDRARASAFNQVVGATLREDREEGINYVRLGSVRLASLIGDESIAETLYGLVSEDPELRSGWIYREVDMSSSSLPAQPAPQSP
jgi:ankyrin repeat protein